MKLHEIEILEKSLTRDDIREFDKFLVDITADLSTRRGFDSDFKYSQFSDMNIRTAIYLGYLMGIKKEKK